MAAVCPLSFLLVRRKPLCTRVCSACPVLCLSYTSRTSREQGTISPSCACPGRARTSRDEQECTFSVPTRPLARCMCQVILHHKRYGVDHADASVVLVVRFVVFLDFEWTAIAFGSVFFLAWRAAFTASLIGWRSSSLASASAIFSSSDNTGLACLGGSVGCGCASSSHGSSSGTEPTTRHSLAFHFRPS